MTSLAALEDIYCICEEAYTAWKTTLYLTIALKSKKFWDEAEQPSHILPSTTRPAGNARLRRSHFRISKNGKPGTGIIEIQDTRYEAIAFERFNHKGLFRESGLWIDLNQNKELDEENEHFQDGALLHIEDEQYQIELRYP